jgi:Ca-activated chloride channel family protein
VAVALFSRFQSDSRLAVLSFAQSPSLIVPFKRDVSEARAAFDQLKSSNQRTAIFEAAAASSRAFEDLPKDPAERRIVILISDGLDNISRIKPSSVIEEARARGVSFYVIHLPLFEPREGRLAVRPPAKGFRELAERTGGRYFLVGEEKTALQQSKKSDLTPVFKAIEDDLRSQYLVGFYVGARARDGRAHRVSISLVPAGFVYSVAQKAYSRTHDFSVNLAAGSTLESPK